MRDSSSDQADRFSARHTFLVDCIGELAERARRVVDLKYGEGRRSREIGELINRSAQAVDMMLSRIRKTLRKCVERKTTEAR